MNLKKKIEEALTSVIDPETKLNVMRMKLIKDLQVRENGFVSLTFAPSSPVCPLAFQLAFSIQDAIKKVDQVNEVNIVTKGFQRADELNHILEQNK
jgi:metal-sulfur cluster biosynthetic enzyme